MTINKKRVVLGTLSAFAIITPITLVVSCGETIIDLGDDKKEVSGKLNQWWNKNFDHGKFNVSATFDFKGHRFKVEKGDSETVVDDKFKEFRKRIGLKW